MKRLLIANRGEIAIRIARAAADMGLPTVAVHSEDDAASLHLRAADEVQRAEGAGGGGLSRHGRGDRGGEGVRLRCGASGLRLPRRARRFRAGLRGCGAHLCRAAGEAPRAVRRQGPRAAGGGCGDVPVIRGIDRALHARGGEGVLRLARAGRGDDHQGAGRRRRARHARGDGRGRDRDRRSRAAHRRRRRRSAATSSMWKN